MRWFRLDLPTGIAVTAAAVACGSSDDDVPMVPGLGDLCVSGGEYHPGFSGFSEREVTVETGHEDCATRLCLINHFRGRVSCPYGQSEPDAADWQDASVEWGNRCRVPGTDGTRPEDRVSVPVAAQKYARRSDLAVYCSCRCANADGGTDDGQDYCRCPDGFDCQHLIDDVGLGNEALTGSYCVKSGTEYEEAATEGSPDCTWEAGFPGGGSEHPYQCGDPIPY